MAGPAARTLPWRGVAASLVYAASLLSTPDASARAAEGGLAVDKATALRAEGKYDEALEVLRSESRDVKRVAGEDSLRLLPINDLAAEILIDQGSLDKAESLLVKVIETRQRLVDSGRTLFNPELARSLMTLSRAQEQAKRYADAAASARQALLIQDQAGGPASADVAAILGKLESILDSLSEFLGPADDTVLAAREETAATFEKLGLFAAATAQRRKILVASETAGNDSAADSLSRVVRLCRLMLLTGRADEAIPILETALQQPATSAPRSVEELRLLGELQLAAGRFIEADASFEAVIAAVRTLKGTSAPSASRDRLNALLVDVRRGRATSLPEWFEPELKALVASAASDREAAIAALAIAAEILVVQGDPTAASGFLTKALSLATAAKPPSPATIADVSGRLAAAHLAADKTAAAFDLAKAALPDAESKLGRGDARVAFLRLVLGDAFRRRDDLTAAAATLRQALARELPRPDDDWEEFVARVVDQLAAVKPDDRFRDLYLESRARQFGPEHRHVGIAASLLGSSRLAAGDWQSAAELFSQSLPVLRAGLGDDHPEVAATQTLLAHAERAAGNPVRAQSTAAGAVDAWERLAGGTHPGTLAAADVLVSARLEAGDTTNIEPLLERLCASGTTFTPIQQAGHLTHLAILLVPRDQARAAEVLARARALPCWQAEASARPQDCAPLAQAAARASFAFKQLGKADQSVEALRASRSWATRSPDASLLLGQIEALAESGQLPPAN